MRRVKIPIDVAVKVIPEIANIGSLPRKKKKQMKKNFDKMFMDKFYKWLENGKSEL
jgi:hypothetical protein